MILAARSARHAATRGLLLRCVARREVEELNPTDAGIAYDVSGDEGEFLEPVVKVLEHLEPSLPPG